MSNKMLIDAAHPEETRVVVLKGNRVEDFDFEAASKKPLRGNIYLAKVTRVEPSLQAAFIEYGGNRHGFLAFAEIHPDYYQIPVADRQALLDEEARAHREEEDEQRNGGARRSRRHRRSPSSEKRAAGSDETLTDRGEDADRGTADPSAAEVDEGHRPAAEAHDADIPVVDGNEPGLPFDEPSEPPGAPGDEEPHPEAALETAMEAESAPLEIAADEPQGGVVGHDDEPHEEPRWSSEDAAETHAHKADAGFDAADGDAGAGDDHENEEEAVEQIGGDALEDVPYRAPRLRRHYKIQEVIKRRQILLVQVVKEERGNKGAALTTYLSLAGRYSVLMPNTARGGGISRKITDSDDRKRLKSIAHELEVPEGMGVILRTAGASRSESEVKRDFEYLLRMWETIRELTLRSSAPALVYEEGSLIKRAIRDLYSKEMEEVCVAGEAAYREAKEFMRLLMPTHAKNVRLYTESQPIFAKAGAEAQLDAMFSNHVTLRSGGYIVINQTEALVAIDVNSGRSTREHNIEDTALRTNLEAADEVARQLRLRDLAGLIVVDFIDMEESRNNRAVERRIKDALKNDRARIQIGRISHFGLLEMSRQRIRTGVLEGSTVLCPHCAGAGTVRSTSSIALHVLRVLEDTLIRSAEFNPVVRTRIEVALYILNQKRAHLSGLELRFGVTISVLADASLTGTIYHALERGEPATPAPVVVARHPSLGQEQAPEDGQDDIEDEIEEDEDDAQDEAESAAPAARHGEGRSGDREDQSGDKRRKRRRRRRGRDRDGRGPAVVGDGEQPSDDGMENMALIGGDLAGGAPEDGEVGEDDDRLPVAVDLEAAADVGEVVEDVTEQLDEPAEAPRRRRTRRSGPRAATATEDAAAQATPEPSADEASPAPRRSRRAKSRAATDDLPNLLGFAPPSADRDVGAPIAKSEVVEDAPSTVPAEMAPESPEPAAVVAPEPVAAEPTAPVAAPAAPEPDRPKRSGWWQRAKATLTGE